MNGKFVIMQWVRWRWTNNTTNLLCNESIIDMICYNKVVSYKLKKNIREINDKIKVEVDTVIPVAQRRSTPSVIHSKRLS